MGKMVRVYLDDQHLQQLSRYNNASQILKMALDEFFENDRRQQGVDEVSQAARAMQDADKLDEAIAGWKKDRSQDRC